MVVTLVWGMQSVSLAQPPLTTFFNSGDMDFSYTGSMSGGFSADGSVTSVMQFPVDASGACVGYYTTSDIPGAEGAIFLGFGGVMNDDSSMDIVVIWINREGESGLSPGTYMMDAEETVSVTYYDDADQVILAPGAPPIVMSAAHAFYSEPGGSVTFDNISHAGAGGTFSCTLEDDINSMTITVSNASFNLERSGVPAESITWGHVKSLY